jgi:hypothetical protein
MMRYGKPRAALHDQQNGDEATALDDHDRIG